MTLVWDELAAERVSAEITYRGKHLNIHVNPNDLTEEMVDTIMEAINAINAGTATPAADQAADQPAPSLWDPLIVQVVREWDIADTRADDEAGRYWPVDLAHAARLPLKLKREMFWAMIPAAMEPNPEPLAAPSSNGSGAPASTTAPAAAGPASGTRSKRRGTAASTPAN